MSGTTPLAGFLHHYWLQENIWKLNWLCHVFSSLCALFEQHELQYKLKTELVPRKPAWQTIWGSVTRALWHQQRVTWHWVPFELFLNCCDAVQVFFPPPSPPWRWCIPPTIKEYESNLMCFKSSSVPQLLRCCSSVLGGGGVFPKQSRNMNPILSSRKIRFAPCSCPPPFDLNP